MLAEGQIVAGKYRVGPFLGEGGMGAVYEATHMGTRRRVAIKVIIHKEAAANRTLVARFQREAVAAGTIDTQHIVQVLDTGFDEERGTPFMVMELLAGEDLAKLLHRAAPLPCDLALRIVGQACSGLHKAHEANVIHRDIKSANIYLAEKDRGEILVKLLDFGIAKIRDDGPLTLDKTAASLTHTGSVLGSPLYMSPEQAIGAKLVEARSDVWSLGVVLYEALTGTTPHQKYETFGRLIIAICQEPAAPVQDLAPWVPPEVAAIAHKALRLRPEDRYESAEAMGEAIRAVLGGSLGIDKSMLDTVSAEERALVRPRLVITGDDHKVSAFASTVSSVSPPEGQPEQPTIDGVSQSMKPRRSAVPAVIAAGIVAIGVGALGASRWAKTPAAPAIAADAATPVTASARPEPTAPSVTSARLEVTPPTAKVDVDGAQATVENGAVWIRGALGSIHRVHAREGARDAVADVAITEQGAIPPRVMLPLEAPRGPSKPHGHAHAAPANGAANASATPTEPTPKPATSLHTTDSFQ